MDGDDDFEDSLDEDSDDSENSDDLEDSDIEVKAAHSKGTEEYRRAITRLFQFNSMIKAKKS